LKVLPYAGTEQRTKLARRRPKVSDHGLLEKLEDDEEDNDRSNNIQRCTAGVAPSYIPLVARCRPTRPE
jgi:hypothetical protein